MRLLAALLLLASVSAGRDIRVRLTKEGAVRTFDLETYVAGVLSAEVSVFRSQEALKAMAVAARTYAVHHAGRHRAEGFDLCDLTHCQAFRPDASEALRGAADATESELLWYGGQTAATYYHRHCGGTTADARELWPNLRAPYLKQQPDTFCLPRETAAWQAELPAESIEILRRTPSGRVAEVLVNGRRLTAEQLHQRVGDAYGWAVIRSNDYRVFPRGPRFLFQGYGFGHGVGLCQTGVEARGKAGHTYRQILAFYYPGTRIGISAQGLTWERGGGERVEVFAATAAEVREVAAAADRAFVLAEQRLGAPIPLRPRIRAYPQVAIYRDATGEPGWVAASSRGAVIRMQPPALLRAKGVLESTLLHEMLHIGVDASAHPTVPGWFREGLVLHLAGGRSGPAQSTEAAAYRRARARVDALVAAHGRAAILGWLRSGIPSQAQGVVRDSP